LYTTHQPVWLYGCISLPPTVMSHAVTFTTTRITSRFHDTTKNYINPKQTVCSLSHHCSSSCLNHHDPSPIPHPN
jgi:hypothetical protein